MSRIEEAMEKAARLRSSAPPQNDASPAEPAAPVQMPTPPSVSMPPTEAIKYDNPFLISVNEPNSAIAEEYRKLKSILVKLTKTESFHNTLMVTSSVASEGKSLTSVNLAISMAREFDHTVLLIDGDLRKPSLHHYLELDAKIGLAECVSEGIDIGDAILKTRIPKLSLLPAGSGKYSPGELFSSQKMKEVVREIKSRYSDRYIIIDTPPVLPFSETRSLSRLVDGVVFVVKEGVVPLKNVVEALEAVKGAPLLGIVYNQAVVDNTKDRYGYSYYYGYGGQ